MSIFNLQKLTTLSHQVPFIFNFFTIIHSLSFFCTIFRTQASLIIVILYYLQYNEVFVATILFNFCSNRIQHVSAIAFQLRAQTTYFFYLRLLNKWNYKQQLSYAAVIIFKTLFQFTECCHTDFAIIHNFRKEINCKFSINI